MLGLDWVCLVFVCIYMCVGSRLCLFGVCTGVRSGCLMFVYMSGVGHVYLEFVLVSGLDACLALASCLNVCFFNLK